ncbi:MAG: hypothetical protein HY682_02075 [Chloroflexi bacterium]|nr:hypothetical protein [Chloroflexota bacterium]
MKIALGLVHTPEVLTDALRTFGDVLPLTYVTRLLQDQWLGFGWDGGALAIVGGIAVITLPASVIFFRWE